MPTVGPYYLRGKVLVKCLGCKREHYFKSPDPTRVRLCKRARQTVREVDLSLREENLVRLPSRSYS